MRKILTKILLTSIILLWFGNISQTNADELGGFERILWEANNELNCDNISYNMKEYYNSTKYKIDNVFNLIKKKSITSQKKIYTNLKSKTYVSIKKLDKDKQIKNYNIIGYIYCESSKNYSYLNNYSVNSSKLSYKIEENWKLYAMKYWKKYLVDNWENWFISNIEILDDRYIIYKMWDKSETLAIYDNNKRKVLSKIADWKLINDNKYIYSCWLWDNSLKLFDIKNDFYKELTKNKHTISNCYYENKYIFFETIENYIAIEYKYSFNSKRLYIKENSEWEKISEIWEKRSCKLNNEWNNVDVKK